jgi:hypothetical protein
MTFTTETVSKAIHEAVADKGPDYVYPGWESIGCTYGEGQFGGDYAPSCIVGHVIAALDIEAFKVIAEAETLAGESCGVSLINQGWDYIAEDGEETTPNLGIPPEAEGALALAQTAQDGGLTWGEALSFFDRSLEVESEADRDYLLAELNAATRKKFVESRGYGGQEI